MKIRELTGDTFHRPQNLSDGSDAAVLYARSYLAIRTTVGCIGIALPFIFVIGEAFFLRGGVHIRGSLSSYYHTSMRDVFVAGLCVVGVLLATYMWAQKNTRDFWFSLVAGLALLGVVFLPTKRPGLGPDAPACGAVPSPDGCSPVQQWLGETPVAILHFFCAGIFILSLAFIAREFGRRAILYEQDPGMARFQNTCATLILCAVAWVIVGGLSGWDILELTPLYVGEVVSVWAFAASWLAKGQAVRDILAAMRGRSRALTTT